jgi:hypothetical protein
MADYPKLIIKQSETMDALRSEIEAVRKALGGYRDSNLASLATTLRKRNDVLEARAALVETALRAQWDSEGAAGEDALAETTRAATVERERLRERAGHVNAVADAALAGEDAQTCGTCGDGRAIDELGAGAAPCPDCAPCKTCGGGKRIDGTVGYRVCPDCAQPQEESK